MKKIKITTEYITLGQFLKFIDIISNGAEAKFYLNEHSVIVNGEVEARRGRKLYPGYKIMVANEEYIVDQ
jgi:S4 domain protein YaaA